jgi:hypothetical protein
MTARNFMGHLPIRSVESFLLGVNVRRATLADAFEPISTRQHQDNLREKQIAEERRLIDRKPRK